MSTPSSTSEYTRLLPIDHGFILATATTMLISLILVFAVKLLFSCRRFLTNQVPPEHPASIWNALLISDAVWFLAHIVAFVQFGIRCSTLGGLTGNIGALNGAQKASLARRNVACQILFLTVLYLSSCSVICLTIAIAARDIAKPPPSVLRNPAYAVPALLFVSGFLLYTLPLVRCNSEYIFPGQQHLCSHADARFIPAIVLSSILDITLVVQWLKFVHRQQRSSNTGRISRNRAPSVIPFILRLLIVGANIAYITIYIRFNHSSSPYYNLIYPEAIAIGVSLVASSSVSLSRMLGKFNFAGVAYKIDPNPRGQNQSALESASKSGPLRSANNDGWGKQAAVLRNDIIGPRRGSAESEEAILRMTGEDAINIKVEIHQLREESTKSSNENL